MKSIFVLTYLIFLSFTGFSQKFEDFSNSKIGKNDLKKIIKVLTSDSLLGRETGTVGQIKAAKYISDRFKELGLEMQCRLVKPRSLNT